MSAEPGGIDDRDPQHERRGRPKAPTAVRQSQPASATPPPDTPPGTRGASPPPSRRTRAPSPRHRTRPAQPPPPTPTRCTPRSARAPGPACAATRSGARLRRCRADASTTPRRRNPPPKRTSEPLGTARSATGSRACRRAGSAGRTVRRGRSPTRPASVPARSAPLRIRGNSRPPDRGPGAGCLRRPSDRGSSTRDTAPRYRQRSARPR